MKRLELDIQRFSGGSYDYVYYKVEQECTERMCDEELNEMIADLVEVLHDLEWWQSGDIGEEDYRTTVDDFKEKWLKNKETTSQIKIEAIKEHLEYENCHYEEYMQYPCEGATHYARVHRNNDDACKRTKIVCEEIK